MTTSLLTWTPSSRIGAYVLQVSNFHPSAERVFKGRQSLGHSPQVERLVRHHLSCAHGIRQPREPILCQGPQHLLRKSGPDHSPAASLRVARARSGQEPMTKRCMSPLLESKRTKFRASADSFRLRFTGRHLPGEQRPNPSTNSSATTSKSLTVAEHAS